MQKIRSRFLCFCFLALCFSACEKQENDASPVALGNGVYIINEGNFQFGNAKVSYFNRSNAAVNEDLYEQVNERPLGDVLQSMCIFNGRVYLVVNNSQKIEVLDAATFKSSGIISGLISPRHFLPINSSKAYVTDLYANAVTIVDLNNNTVTGSIPCSGWTEEMVLSNGKAFVTNLFRDKVYVLNTATDVLQDSIAITYSSNSIREDKNGKIWVLCGGNKEQNLFAALHRINPATLQVEQSFLFPQINDNPWRLNINGAGDTLYYLNNGVCRMAITETTLPANTFIPENNRNFYGVGIDPGTNIVYVADAIDYVQRGLVYRYSASGALVDSFKAGIVPGNFWFD